MEMEFKLRQQQETNCATLRNPKRSNGHNQQAQKIVTFDENNNNNNNSEEIQDTCKTVDNNINDTDLKDQLQRQQQQLSDEEWRSMSPNVEPTNGTFKSMSSPLKQVSAELVCEKLREYRATCGSAGQRSTTTDGRNPVTAAPATASADADAGELSTEAETNKVAAGELRAAATTTDSISVHQKTSEQVPIVNSNSSSIISSSANGNHLNSGNQAGIISNQANGNHLDEIQLMSIDPTLCHSSGNDGSGSCAFNVISPRQADPEAPIACHEREEQTVNEEFSSSNSSFGPMSISVAAIQKQEIQQPTGTSSIAGENQPPHGGDKSDRKSSSVHASSSYNEVSDEEGEESNSAQSGSVLTVITAQGEMNQIIANNESSSDVSEIQTNSINLNSEEPSVAKNGDDDLLIEMGEEDEEDTGSNIGVAFESLHFDSEIKSSKQEKVDEELFFGTPPAPAAKFRSMVPKFNANEVKSVCNFITAAISDATRQVESYMRPNSRPASPSVRGEGNSEQSDEIGRPSVVGSIQRATFVQQSPDHIAPRPAETSARRAPGCGIGRQAARVDDVSNGDTSDDDAQTIGEGGRGDDGDGDDVPKADLSSIFEANVRREIERFETNSMVRKSFGNKLVNKNGLTEWRIAEEIRLFNEREMELKRRFESSEKLSSSAQNANQLAENQQQSAKESAMKSRQQQQEATASRFGKTLNLAKPVASDLSQTNGQLLSQKSIKLTTVANCNGQNNTNGHQQTISMHKFIASGGKRFVFTSSTTGGSGTSINGNQQQQQMNSPNQQPIARSMTNLSIAGTGANRNDGQARTVDYKAADSLKCKETPNVRPGLTRKVIESFLRMNHESSSRSMTESSQMANNSIAANNNRFLQSSAQQSSAKSSSQSSSCSSFSSCPSAELKIQEELREMRQREAELRSQRNHFIAKSHQQQQQQQHDQSAPLNGLDSISMKSNNINININVNNGNHHHHHQASEKSQDFNGGDDYSTNNNYKDDNSDKVMGRADSNGRLADDRLSFSSESLYPIKQTIDSFRKLNDSSNQKANNNNLMQTQVNLDTKSKRYQQSRANKNEQQATHDDYDSRVGGQRRKITMIERWENGLH